MLTPTNQAAPAVNMNSPILVPFTGTPTARAASRSPPVAKIQLPILVRHRIQVAISVNPPHHNSDTRKSDGAVPNTVATIACSDS